MVAIADLWGYPIFHPGTWFAIADFGGVETILIAGTAMSISFSQDVQAHFLSFCVLVVGMRWKWAGHI